MINRSESQLIARDQDNQVRKTSSRPQDRLQDRKPKRVSALRRKTR